MAHFKFSPQVMYLTLDPLWNVFFSMRTAKKARRQVGLLRTLPIYLARTRTTGTALEHTLRPCPGRLRNMESRA